MDNSLTEVWEQREPSGLTNATTTARIPGDRNTVDEGGGSRDRIRAAPDPVGSGQGYGAKRSDVIEEEDESESKENSRPSSAEIRGLENTRAVGRRVRPKSPVDDGVTTETDNAIATAEALTELIEERLRSIRGNSNTGQKRPLSGIKSPSRPLSGNGQTGPPLNGDGRRNRPSSGRLRQLSGTPDNSGNNSGRPLSGTKSSSRPQSGNSRPSSAVGSSGRVLSGREARLNAQNVTRPATVVIKNYVDSGPSSGVNNQDTITAILHTGPRPSFRTFFQVSDTVTRIRKWSQAKYRRRQALESRGSSESRRSKRSSDSRRSRHSTRRLQEMADAAESAQEAEAAAKRRRTRTFAWYSRVIKAVVKLCLDMQKLSMQKTEQTPISEMYYINISGPSTGNDDPTQQLFFDKSWFSRKRATSRVPLWAQAVTIKHPRFRTEEDVQRLHTLLLNMRSFKEKFTEDMRLKMCKVVRYTQCDAGRVVLRQGHYGQDFYFIFTGSVFIQIDLEDPYTGNVTTTTENIIRNGESFGEIALMGDGERSACVICREPTELFQIDKTTFMDVCPGIFKVELSEKMAFAKKFPIFKGWDPEQFESLCFNSQVLYIPHGRTIEQDWSKANYVYFVMTGRVSLLKRFSVSDMLDLTAKGMMDKELHYRKPDNEEVGGGSRTKQACVGCIREGENTDLRLLSLEPSTSIVPITLMSEGVKLLRVAVRTFKRMCPRRQVEDYLKKDYTPIDIPTNSEICEKVFKDTIWTSYKKSVVRTVELEQSGFAIAHLPATVKGTSGWARWPGFDDEAEEKTGRLTCKTTRSYVDPFIIVKTPKAKIRPELPVQRKANERGREVKRDIIVETEEEHGILPIVIQNDRSMISKPRGVTNGMELRTNVSRLIRQEEMNPSTKSVFLTEPEKE
ncbi:uncharacterized protein [Haliotis cracherodii]|uniref:uncharacterized protein n=1 Tax=Haliotis cracherodii TaxID=6455 RepID=UPI0039EA8D4F